MNAPSFARVLSTILVLLLVAGCHDRVSERLASEYRSTMLKWQLELYNNREGLEKSAGSLLDLEIALQEDLGLAWYTAHRNDAWLERELKPFAKTHAEWSQAMRKNNSDAEMFIASTDEWVRNLSSSNLSRETSAEMWLRMQEDQKDLVATQATLLTQLNTVVKVQYASFLNRARMGGTSDDVAP